MNAIKTIQLGVLIPLTAFFSISGISAKSETTPAKSQSSKSSIIANNAKPQLISSQFKFTEGPAADKKGNVFFTDQPNDHIWKYSIDGELSLFMDKTGRSNGMYFDKNGNLMTAADEKNEIWSITPDKKITVVLDSYEGKLFNGPNDLWIDSKGGIYFTDPYYQRPYWERKKTELDGQHVYYLPKGATQPFIVDHDIVKPNGIVGSADGRILYVADIAGKKTYKYEINQDGSLSNRQLFANMGSDGMTIDNRGNLYLSGNGVTVFNSQGEKIEYISVPGWTANVCFGGKKRNILFLTSTKSVYTLKMKVKGI